MRIIGTVGLVFALAASAPAGATEQFADQITIDGKTHALFALPFSDYVLQDDRLNDGAFQKLHAYIHERCTASVLGYRAFWRIEADELRLVRLVANPCQSPPDEVPLRIFFPNAKGPVSATWYSGKLVVPAGNVVSRVPFGYGANYDKYLVLTVDKGRVTKRVETDKP